MNKLYIISLILKYAALFDIDPNLALSVAKTESQLIPNAIGKVGEIGIFQIRPEYSTLTKNQLLNPEINIIEGLQKIKEAKMKCPHKKYFIICYNTGVAGARNIKYPKEHVYVKKVYSHYLYLFDDMYYFPSREQRQNISH